METVLEHNTGATFETAWAAIQKLAQSQEESKERFDREMQESKKEWDRKFGSLSNRFGEVVEHLVSPNLKKKFNALGFAFSKTSTDVSLSNKDFKFLAEVDVLLENSNCALAVEVKAKPTTEDVKEHIERMEKLRVYADEHNDTRLFYGAIAGAIMSESVKTYTLKSGFYAIEQSGDTLNITPPEGSYVPKTW
jgi:hypothetical protein